MRSRAALPCCGRLPPVPSGSGVVASAMAPLSVGDPRCCEIQPRPPRSRARCRPRCPTPSNAAPQIASPGSDCDRLGDALARGRRGRRRSAAARRPSASRATRPAARDRGARRTRGRRRRAPRARRRRAAASRRRRRRRASARTATRPCGVGGVARPTATCARRTSPPSPGALPTAARGSRCPRAGRRRAGRPRGRAASRRPRTWSRSPRARSRPGGCRPRMSRAATGAGTARITASACDDARVGGRARHDLPARDGAAHVADGHAGLDRRRRPRAAARPATAGSRPTPPRIAGEQRPAVDVGRPRDLERRREHASAGAGRPRTAAARGAHRDVDRAVGVHPEQQGRDEPVDHVGAEPTADVLADRDVVAGRAWPGSTWSSGQLRQGPRAEHAAARQRRRGRSAHP